MTHIDPNAPMPAGTVLFVAGITGSGRGDYLRSLSEIQTLAGAPLQVFDGSDIENVAKAAELAESKSCVAATIHAITTVPAAESRLKALGWQAPAGVNVRVALCEIMSDGRKVVRVHQLASH
ncbi:MAG: hypothetical protein O9327_03360 [Polaromonas sp.]|nr:hypothetical protein [Polaromonas sp.]